MQQNVYGAGSIWIKQQECSLEAFRREVETELDTASVPLADAIELNIPVYSGDAIRARLENENFRSELMSEWGNNFLTGSGVMVIRQGYADLSLIDEVSDVLLALVAEEESAAEHKGDHFAPAGSNSRLWNAHEKLAITAPELYIRYNANPLIALASRCWLGPMYQVTAQVNLVRPGGQAQSCHRDYHLGFVSNSHLYEFPRVVHTLSAALTLQGGIAHCDMPVESGPTKVLPFSQRYTAGYIAAQLPEFSEYFESHYVQLKFSKGDLVFFNPAVFHAAGENRTKDIQRLVNLLQIGSGFGRSIETVDTARICRAVYAQLLSMDSAQSISEIELDSVIAASAEGYAFPTNLDLDSPTDSMIPPSEQDLLRKAVAEHWSEEQFDRALADQAMRRRSH